MTTIDIKDPKKQIRKRKERIIHLEQEILHKRDQIDIMQHEIEKLEGEQTADKFMVDAGFR